MQLVLSTLAVLLVGTGAFDYQSFERKYCYSDYNVSGIATFFPYKLEDYLLIEEEAYICENFVLMEEDLEYMARNDFEFAAKKVTTIFKNCEIEYFNEYLVSKFTSSNWIRIIDCKVGFKNPRTIVNSTVTEIFTIGFHNCEITNNLRSQALHKFTDLKYLLFQNCTFQHPTLDNILLVKQNLEDLVIDDCNINNFEKGILSKNEKDMRIISCSSCGLKEIEPLLFGMNKDVSSLVSFTDNFLTKLPTSLDLLANMESLVELDISRNKITEPVLKRIHFKSLSNLKILNLSRNDNITAIAYKTFSDTYLKTLNMSMVNLKTLRKLGNGNLTTIDFSYNNISVINSQVFEGLFNLISLNMSGNAISKLQVSVFQDLKNLKELRLSFNYLSKLPKNIFNTLKSLEILDLSSNALDRVDGFERLTSLKKLFLTNNYLKIIPSGRSLPRSLRILDISHNTLQFIGNNTFSNLGKLTSLDMSETNDSYFIDSNIFEHLKSLKVLKMSLNGLTTIENIFFPLTVESIDLSFNKISVISDETFDSLNNLHYLNLSHNNIRSTGKYFTSRFPQIKYVDITDQGEVL